MLIVFHGVYVCGLDKRIIYLWEHGAIGHVFGFLPESSGVIAYPVSVNALRWPIGLGSVGSNSRHRHKSYPRADRISIVFRIDIRFLRVDRL